MSWNGVSPRQNQPDTPKSGTFKNGPVLVQPVVGEPGMLELPKVVPYSGTKSAPGKRQPVMPYTLSPANQLLALS